MEAEETYLRINLTRFNVAHSYLLPNPVVPRIIPLFLVHLFGGIVTSPHEIKEDR